MSHVLGSFQTWHRRSTRVSAGGRSNSRLFYGAIREWDGPRSGVRHVGALRDRPWVEVLGNW